MKYLKFIVILMGLLIFFGTAGVIYIIYDRVFSKQTLVFPEVSCRYKDIQSDNIPAQTTGGDLLVQLD